MADEIEIIVENDGIKVPDDDPIEIVSAPKTPVAVDDVEKTLENLKQQLADEQQGRENDRQARIAAEKDAHEARSSVVQARSEVRDSELGQISGAIETTKANIEIFKTNYRIAREANDIDAELAAQVEMSRASAVLIQLEQGKQSLESAPKPEAPAAYRPSDPVEAIASQLTPKSAAWVRAHPEYASGQKYGMMVSAHNIAIGRGITPESDEYFNLIERTLDLRQPDTDVEIDPMADAARPAQRRQSPPAAPVSRSGNGTGGTPGRVTLSAEEVEMAEMMGQTTQEYARNKLALQREGKLN